MATGMLLRDVGTGVDTLQAIVNQRSRALIQYTKRAESMCPPRTQVTVSILTEAGRPDRSA